MKTFLQMIAGLYIFVLVTSSSPATVTVAPNSFPDVAQAVATETLTVTPTPSLTATETVTATNALTVTTTLTATNALTGTTTLSPTRTATVTKTITRTRAPATPAPKQPPLVAALSKTGAVKTMRFDLKIYFSDPYRELELFTLAGEQAGNLIHATAGGLLAGLLSGGGATEVFYTDNQTYYLRGGTWYVRTDTPTAQGKVLPKRLLSTNLTEFSKIGNEDVDGRPCDIYTIDKPAGRRVLESSGALPPEIMNNVVNVEFTYWVCNDGYVHRSRTRTDLLRPDGGTNISRVEMHTFDFGAPIQLNVPANAQPAP